MMLTTFTMHVHGSSVIIVNCSLSYQQLVPWFCIAGCFELKSWSMFSDRRFLPVEDCTYMIVTDKIIYIANGFGFENFQNYNDENGYLNQNHIAIPTVTCSVPE